MCGISGIINKTRGSVSKSDLKQINDLIIHRGPDAEGFYFKNEVGFGHRRLSILDLSELGSQPMTLDDLTITYNGEIYNYIEIREELQALGYSFKSESDTEVILAAYKQWGKECIHRFNGMWAFAIHDSSNDEVFITRDRFGIKPLYYKESNLGFYFGSEIKQLLYFDDNPTVNKQILFDYLYLSYHHHTNDTFFEGISSLEPGHNLIFCLKTQTFKIKRYYDLKKKEEFEGLNFDEALKKYGEKIRNSIKLRLRSDVKVGTCLSGGMDSSFIASYASKFYNKNAQERFTAITAKSTEKKTDESHFAKKVVENSNLNWALTEPSKEEFLKYLDEVINVQEEPFGSPSIIMQYFVMKKAKEEGCIVMLDGQGGDETLLGYDRYYATYINEQKGIYKKIKAFLAVSKNSKLTLKDVFLYNLYFGNATVRRFRQIVRHNYIKKDFRKYFNIDFLKQISAINKDVNKLQYFEITKVQLQKLLKYEDRNSMAQSIETRVPFIDYEVVELAISLPFEYKIKNGWSKYILRKTADDLIPNEIVWRKNKFGFEAPKNTWLSDKEYFLTEIRNSPFLSKFIDGNRINGKLDNITLWKLYNIAIWANKFKVEFKA